MVWGESAGFCGDFSGGKGGNGVLNLVGGYNELRSNRKQGAVELETRRDGTGNELRWNGERGAM